MLGLYGMSYAVKFFIVAEHGRCGSSLRVRLWSEQS